jgi:hypothetical protein
LTPYSLWAKLADELGDERQVRTLSRWMAHYIAEQIEEAHAASPHDRDAKRAQVADAILKLWRHHAHFANGQRPFEEFEPVMRTLESLDPDNPDSRYHQIWPAREPLNDEQKEVQQWLDAARGIDHSARTLMRLFLRYAADNASDKSREWVSLAARAGLDQEPTIRVVRFILDGKEGAPEEDEDELRLQQAIGRNPLFYEAASVVCYENCVTIGVLVIIHDEELMEIRVMQRKGGFLGFVIVNEPCEARSTAFNIPTIYLAACIAERRRFHFTEYRRSWRVKFPSCGKTSLGADATHRPCRDG